MFAVWTSVGVAVVLLLARTAAQHRRHAEATTLHLCRGCGNVPPANARFCSRCGRPAVG